MNKKAIWLIIGLMTAALIGVFGLQMHWIKKAIELKEDEFDARVFSALGRIVDVLSENEEQQHSLNMLSRVNAFSNFSQTIWQSQFPGTSSGPNPQEVMVEFATRGNSSTALLDPSDRASIISAQLKGDTCTCSNCVRDRYERYERQFTVLMEEQLNSIFNPRKLYERLSNPAHLDSLLMNEFENRGININFEYGIYSNNSGDFIIANNGNSVGGRYLVFQEDIPHYTQPSYAHIYQSEYRVDLFPHDLLQSPGMLMIYFPSKARVVWGSVSSALLLSVLFTSIILFCFLYTIQVIFRQKKLSEMKTDFINNMTHEFKTPIATISLAADSITSPMISGNEGKVRRFANIIKLENKRMNSQVEKVLQMALIDKEEFHLNLTEINLHEVINRAAANTNLQVEKREGKVITDLQATRANIEGDLTHVSNMIHNLLDNANKYSPEKPEISLHTRNVPNGVEVVVQDKGMGMTKEARKHIFDRFYRVHTGNLHDVKGFGLGLSYVKAMITAHQGQIDVKSELGKGSSFILFFPFHQ